MRAEHKDVAVIVEADEIEALFVQTAHGMQYATGATTDAIGADSGFHVYGNTSVRGHAGKIERFRMGKKEYTKLVIAIFDNESAAQTAAESLKAWDKANDDVKAGAVGVLIADGRGGITQDLVGPHATGKGATIGAILGLIAAIPTGGLSLLGGVVSGGVGGGIVGAFFHKHLGISEEESNRLAKEIADGQAAVGVLAGADEADAFAAKLAELGGKPEAYDVTAEGVETAAAAATQADAPNITAGAPKAAGPEGAATEGAATESAQGESSKPTES